MHLFVKDTVHCVCMYLFGKQTAVELYWGQKSKSHRFSSLYLLYFCHQWS